MPKNLIASTNTELASINSVLCMRVCCRDWGLILVSGSQALLIIIINFQQSQVVQVSTVSTGFYNMDFCCCSHPCCLCFGEPVHGRDLLPLQLTAVRAQASFLL